MVFFGTFFAIVFFALLRAGAHTRLHTPYLFLLLFQFLFLLSLSLSTSLCAHLPTANEQHTSTSVMLAKKNGNIHFHHMFLLLSILFCNARVFVSLNHFLFVRIISNIANKTIIVTTTPLPIPPALLLPLPLPYCLVANIIVKQKRMK